MRTSTTFQTILMLCFCSATIASEPSTVSALKVEADDWPWWRGPQRNGIANPNQNPPLTWSNTENILWKTAIPGRGHGSATVMGDQVFLAAADPDSQQQLVQCFDRQSGSRLWSTIVHEGGFPDPKIKRATGNKKASFASSTVACDGELLFINFLNDGAVYTTALDRNGNQIWQTKVSDYVIHQGYGSSPAIYQNLVIVSADNKGEGGGAVAGLERATGKVVWKRARPAVPNYASPAILNVAGKDQLLFTGCDLVTSLHPLTGKELWEIEGATTECVTTTVTDGTHIFTSGGYPKNHIAAVVADGSGKIAWENNTRTYVPSMLVSNGHLYAVLDAGIATCWKSDTGEEIWKGRLSGTFSSSPVLVGNRIYVANEDGTTFIFRASPDEFEELGRNKLGDSVFATPTICGGKIYWRVAHWEDGKRQEYLYCLAASPKSL